MVISDKIMFEIYKETTYNDVFKVVYFTELGEHDKDFEIERALEGEHFYDGFIKELKKEEAKKIIDEIVDRLNEGEEITLEEIDKRLEEYTA